MNERKHLARVEMYRAAAELLGPGSHNGYYPPAADLEVLEISGENFRDLLPWGSYETLSDADVCSGIGNLAAKVQSRRFDLVVLDQVLEHVIDPQWALTSIRVQLLRPRGRVFVSTPFLIRVHPAPLDLWRWTREGLDEILMRSDFNNIVTGGWGNKAAVIANLEGWPEADDASDMQNDPAFPVTIWAVGTR